MVRLVFASWYMHQTYIEDFTINWAGFRLLQLHANPSGTLQLDKIDDRIQGYESLTNAERYIYF